MTRAYKAFGRADNQAGSADRTGRRYRMGCILLVLAGLSIAGCGYSMSRPFPQNVRTVYVEMFHTREFRRDLEFNLTEALQKQILQDTPYKIADKRTADTVITGEVLEVRQNILGRTFETGQPRELVATFVIRFTWRDMRTGKVLLDRPRFVQSIDYVPPVGETFEIASDRALGDLAERMVEEMMTAW